VGRYLAHLVLLPGRAKPLADPRRSVQPRAGWHGAGGLIVPDNLSLVTLPPYAPGLNPIENVWAYLRSNKLAVTDFDRYDAIVAKCCEAWNFFANDPSAIASITARGWAEVSS
jgi:transposase